MKKYILGIDIGTSGTKTILVDDEGRVAAAKTVEYPMETPRPGWTPWRFRRSGCWSC